MWQIACGGCLYLILMPVLTPVFAWLVDGPWAGLGVIALEGLIALANRKNKDGISGFLCLIFIVLSIYYGISLLNSSRYL